MDERPGSRDMMNMLRARVRTPDFRFSGRDLHSKCSTLHMKYAEAGFLHLRVAQLSGMLARIEAQVVSVPLPGC